MSPIQIVLLAFAAFTILGVLVACVEICLAKRTRLVTSFSYGPIPDLSVVLFVIIVVCLLFAWARTASTTKTGDVHVSATLSEETILACPMMHKAQVAYLAWKEASESGTTVTRDKRYEIEQRIVRRLKPKQKIEFLGVPPSELGFYAQLEDGSRGVLVGDFNLTSEQVDSIYAEKLTGDGGKLISSERFFEMVQNKTLSAKNIIVIDKANYSQELLQYRLKHCIKKLPFVAINKKTKEQSRIFTSIEECKRELQLPSNCHIGEVLKGMRKSSNGYIFMYVEEGEY